MEAVGCTISPGSPLSWCFRVLQAEIKVDKRSMQKIICRKRMAVKIVNLVLHQFFTGKNSIGFKQKNLRLWPEVFILLVKLWLS